MIDRASHAFGGRRTTRSEHIYGVSGTVYVLYRLRYASPLNVVTNKKDTPHAILVRALEPMEGINYMLKRAGKTLSDITPHKRPRNLARAMGNF